MKKAKTIITLITAYLILFSCGNNASNSVNSAEENAKEIKIGTQTWATKNLDVSPFRNGDTIPETKTNEEWMKAGNAGKPAWCYYDNDPANGKKYGKLYNWYAINDPRGLAPKGWHIPSDAEWIELTNYLGGEKEAFLKMKDIKDWNDYNGKAGNGNNQSGFSGTPGGDRSFSGIYSGIGSSSSWWSSSEVTKDFACYRSIDNNFGFVFKGGNVKGFGLSVRCLKD